LRIGALLAALLAAAGARANVIPAEENLDAAEVEQIVRQAIAEAQARFSRRPSPSPTGSATCWRSIR